MKIIARIPRYITPRENQYRHPYVAGHTHRPRSARSRIGLRLLLRRTSRVPSFISLSPPLGEGLRPSLPQPSSICWDSPEVAFCCQAGMRCYVLEETQMSKRTAPKGEMMST